ncbi:MAG: winged helix-turn-helix domain-containing protein [Candidatus Omnitrophica bacterium]|nr:winged helix-turn-helix domain-containing protein [Candidatus Omnitrophota bacterium]
MITRIGIVAGEIWQLLEANDIMSLKNIVIKLDRPEYLILMSVGWLSREGHIVVDEEDGSFKVSLREKRKAEEMSR